MRTATPSTGGVQSAGGDAHDSLLWDVEDALTKRGFSVAIHEQTSRSQPDATAVHPQYDGVFALEAETTTPDCPAAILTNLARAQTTDHTPLFVVRPGDQQTDLAARVDAILATPVKTRRDGTDVFYNTRDHIQFNGGATAHNGLTAVRPATESVRTVWKRHADEWVVSDGDTDFTSHPPTGEFSKDEVPGVYSYDRTTGEYTVHTQDTTTTYHAESQFTSDWTPIKRPFIPTHDLPHPAYTQDDYTILILPPNNPPLVYQDGTTHPLPAHPDPTNLPPHQPTPETAQPTPETDPAVADTIDTVSDGAKLFIDKYLAQDLDSELPNATIYHAYTAWTSQLGIEATTQRWFSRTLREKMDVDTRRVRRNGDRVQLYEGITLTTAGSALLEE